MVPEATPRRFTNDERAYLYARAVLLALLIALYISGVLTPETALTRFAYLGSLGLFAAGTLAVPVASRGFGVRLERAMIAVLPLDLVAISAFTLFGSRDDVFYPVCVLFPVLFALVLRKREAWVVAAAVSVAYMVGHWLMGQHGVVDYVLFSLKALAIPVIGAVVSNSAGKQRMREEEARLAVEERADMNLRLQRRVSELQAVSEITELVHSTLDFETVGPMVLDIVAKVIGVASCCLFVIDKEKSETLFSASVGSVGSPAPAASDVSLLDPSSLDDHFTCLPIFDHGTAMVLFCARADDIEALAREDRLVLTAVASELVVAVENSLLYKLTKRLAITDELSGLYNYRHLQQRLDDEIARASRYSNHVSMLMIDVDDFKGYNDTHGHISGDGALSEIAAVLRSAVREVDLVARYGGEEFSIVMPETDSAGAFVAAEKVREAVATHLFADADGVRDCSLTVSIGLASYPTHAWDKESLLREADDALYRAKSGGKDRVRTPKRTTQGIAVDPAKAVADADSARADGDFVRIAPSRDSTGEHS